MELTSDKRAGFTLTELMITFAIVVVITVIALPSINSYITQGKVSDAILSVNELQKAIEANIIRNARTENSGLGVSLPSKLGRYVQNFSVNNDGLINISTTEPAGKLNFSLNPNYDAETKQVSWRCAVTSSSFNDYVPEHCRVAG